MVLEKPLGRDLASADKINEEVGAVFDEHQIYRIDHYLGKETVQNLIALRFGNALFEPLWSRASVRDVQITLAETVGVEGRGEFYDGTGALRDMVQNHLLQLLCIVAMEPPSSIDADAMRDEKLKVLRALRPFTPADVATRTVRGQYRAGAIDGKPVPAISRSRGSPPTAVPRPSSRSRPSSTTGAGPACRSTCAPASACRSGSPKWWSIFAKSRTRCSVTVVATACPTGW